MSEKLTAHELVRLSAIVEAVIRNARVGWLDSRGEVATGTLRSVGDERGNFLGEDVDVRDGFVRITTSAGWELFRPLRELAEEYSAGTFVLDYRD